MKIILEKDGVIANLFKNVGRKRILLNSIVESPKLDRLEVAQEIADEMYDIEQTAWEFIFAEYPEANGKQCVFNPYPPSVTILD